MDKPESNAVVIKLRLGACLTGPTKRLAADLHEAAQLYNVARNAIVRAWERNAEAKPADAKFSESWPANAYQEAWHTVPTLARKIVSAATQEVSAKLRARTPYNHPGKARYVWQAMLAFETSRPCYRGKELPVPCQDAKLCLNDSGYTLKFPVWSEASGRQKLSHTCRIPTHRLPPGYKRHLLNIVNRDWKLCDSKLHWHEPKSRRGKGHWAIHLVYLRPQEPLKGLDKTRVAKLTLQGGDGKAPFEIATDGAFPWSVGAAKVMQSEFSRLETRRLAMRARHRDKSSGRRGHGRQRVEESIRPTTRAVKELAHRMQWHAVSEILKFCERYQCGTVEWSDPSMGQRANCWLSKNGVQWDWTGFQSRLKHKLWVNGVDLCERPGDAPKAGGRSRKAKTVKATINGKMVKGKAKAKQAKV